MTLAEHIQAVQARIAAAAEKAGRDPSEVTLVAATKVQTSETIRATIAAGITVCGENRAQVQRFTLSGTCRRTSSNTWWARWT